jgi:hypothetical protein
MIMEVVAISANLLLAYGAIVLAAGAGIGVIIGRAMRPRRPHPRPDLPEQLQQRVERLEQEAEYTQALLEHVLKRAHPARELPPSNRRFRAA